MDEALAAGGRGSAAGARGSRSRRSSNAPCTTCGSSQAAKLATSMPKSSASALKRGGDLGTVRFGPIQATAASKRSRSSVIGTTSGPRPGTSAGTGGAAGGG
eukprot:175669-Alexandrium_andersonii.AAC.1